MSPPPTNKVPKIYFFHCVAKFNRLGNSSSHQLFPAISLKRVTFYIDDIMLISDKRSVAIL